MWQRKSYISFAFAAFSFFIIIYLIYCNTFIDQYKIVTTFEPRNKEKQKYIILLWNYFFDNPTWYLPSTINDEKYFKKLNCPSTNCIVTSERNYLNSIIDYDAVLFHGPQPFPLLNPVPSIRSPDQFYVFCSQESPAETKHNLRSDYGFFNLSMTYRLDSDVSWFYNGIKDIESGAVMAPSLKPKWRPIIDINVEQNTNLINIIKKKNKFGAWFVSHCNAFSQRDQLIAKLQKFVEIDIFGKCGNLSCPRGSPYCDKMLEEKYKFYFSFENSICVDYVTEKFFNALKLNIIPVVFGGANYSRFGPPKSYINAEDFKTVKELAEYLIFLDEHPAEYAKYFWWKTYYKVEKDNNIGFCQLCTILNQPNRVDRKQVYGDIENWWLGNTCRFNSKINT